MGVIFAEAGMKSTIRILLAVIMVLLMSATSGQADRGGRHGGGWGWGPAVGLGLGLGLWELSRPYYGYPYYPYYNPAPVIEQPSTEMYAVPAPQRSVEPTYWYYCRVPEGYYPNVKRCPDGWMKVVPSAPQPQ